VPLYEYECGRCGRFELIRKFSDPLLSVCPTCGDEVQKLLSAPAFQFKGTGWYVTDYARKPSGGDAKGKGGDPKGGDTPPSSGDGKGKGASAEGSATPKAAASKDSAASGSNSTK
jgi:putative FmdB family regulatory protein